jgi:hypothetical protein
MHKGFKGLSGLVYDHLEQEQGKNVVYAFINKQKKQTKTVALATRRICAELYAIGKRCF